MEEKFNFTAKIEMTVTDSGKPGKVTHEQTKYDCDFSANLRTEKYRENGVLNKEGCNIFTVTCVEGLIANIHSCHLLGYRDSAEHLRYIINRLEHGFVQQVNTGIGEWEK